DGDRREARAFAQNAQAVPEVVHEISHTFPPPLLKLRKTPVASSPAPVRDRYAKSTCNARSVGVYATEKTGVASFRYPITRIELSGFDAGCPISDRRTSACLSLNG